MAGNTRMPEMTSLRVDKRQNLAEVIPLSTPLMLRIEPSNLCNFKCSFCPTGDKKLLHSFKRPHGLMDYALFTKIIDDLKLFSHKLKKLYLYKDGEPLLNPRLPEMIRYARDAHVAEEIWITTNGSLLNPTINRLLVEAGLDLIKISVYGISEEDYRNFSHIKLDYPKFLENLRDLYDHHGSCRIHVKILDHGLSPDEAETATRLFTPLSTSLNIDRLMGWSISSVKDFTMNTHPETSPDGLPILPKEVCPFPFYSLAVNFNGTVSICCVDWSHSTIVGDLTKKSLVEIWNGKELFDFRCMHLRKERSRNRACADCQFLSTLPDYLDDAAETILAKILPAAVEKRLNSQK
jgi:radical SAM protein with 4Fe4S-binding SPASM domain